MNFESFRNYCLAKKKVSESLPFDQKTLVFKVVNKIFALADMDDFVSVNLKCDPDRAMELRESFSAIKPGYHMNKKHWNTVMFNENLDNSLLYELIDLSYDLVVASLPKNVRDEL
jgi:predicted DNA-binding protein (MmcQ/YjbR family)